MKTHRSSAPFVKRQRPTSIPSLETPSQTEDRSSCILKHRVQRKHHILMHSTVILFENMSGLCRFSHRIAG